MVPLLVKAWWKVRYQVQGLSSVHVIYQLKKQGAYHFMILIIIQAPNIMYIAKAYSKYLL